MNIKGDEQMNETASSMIGHNNPPLTPFEEAQAEIDGLYDEACGWLDGEAVNRQELADGISELLNLIRKHRKKADDARKTENKPFDDGKAEVQARYNPLLKKADLAMETCKKALVPWLDKLDREKKEAAEKARLEAEEKARAAQEAFQTSAPDNLEEREKAEALLADAKAADTAANKAARDTAKTSGGVGKAVSLRTTYKPILHDPFAAAKHYWQTDRKSIEDLLLSLAGKDVRNGKREIPGFEVIEQKTVA